MLSVRELTDLPDSFFDEYQVIYVDEAQFLRGIVTFCEHHANAGRIVVVSALDSDADRNPFGEICDLMPKAEKVTKLSAVCMVCHRKDAAFTKRLVRSNAIELIGGADMYEARCRGCWNAPIPDTNPASTTTVATTAMQRSASEVSATPMLSSSLCDSTDSDVDWSGSSTSQC